MLHAAAAVYGAAARWRRRWYSANPSRQRRLGRPVISIGNLRAGGSGKTPAVECVARVLLASGERPVILTRGYARRTTSPDVTVVSDGSTILTDVDHAGDEPLMLARRLRHVPVLVHPDRYTAGRAAEERFQPTVHILDDGFQHLQLARDVDLVIVSPEDLSDALLPEGALREDPATAAAADALLVSSSADEWERTASQLRAARAFRVERTAEQPYRLRSRDESGPIPRGRVLAIAAIARPERFFGDLARSGWIVADTMSFRDHHWFTRADIESIARRAGDAKATAIVTTEKDAGRFETCDLADVRQPIVVVPVAAAIEPAAAFSSWLRDRLERVRGAGGSAAGQARA